MDDLPARVERLYAAVGEVTDAEVEKYPPQVVVTPKVHGIYQDFTGGATQAQLANTLHSLIYNVANLHDHLKGWAAKHGGDKNTVHSFLHGSDDYCIVLDLANNDRHPYPPRNGGHSGKSPKVGEVSAVLRLTASAGKPAMMFLGAGGKVNRTGTAERIITGDVVDNGGNRLGDANEILTKAVTHCEAALVRFGPS